MCGDEAVRSEDGDGGGAFLMSEVPRCRGTSAWRRGGDDEGMPWSEGGRSDESGEEGRGASS